MRACLLGLALMVPNAYLIIQLEVVRAQAWPTILSLYMNALFALVLLALLNLPLRKWLPRFAFSPGEMLTVYIILGIGTALVGTDYMQVLVTMLGYSTYYASASNRWASLFANDLPSWLVVKDKAALDGFYLGHSTLFTASHLRAWGAPIAWWTFFILAMFWVMLCMSALLRKQWTDRERLTYPIVYLPLQVSSGPALFRSRLMWVGFGISSLIALINGLNTFYPSLPAIPVKILQLRAPQERPWLAIGDVPLYFHPFVIGIAMLMPVDLSFSCWFFVWFQRLEGVGAQVIGWDIRTWSPELLQQSAGAFIGICVFTLANERRYFGAVLRKAMGRPSDLDDEGEPLPYRTAVVGLVLGLAALAAFSLQAGMSLPTLASFLCLYFAMSLALTRLRAELGTPAHDLPFVGPERFMVDAVGTSAFARRDLVMMSLYYWFNRSYGSHPMPVQLEGFRLAQEAAVSQRSLVGIMLLAALVGTLACFGVMVGLAYRFGAATGLVEGGVYQAYAQEAYGRLESWLTTGQAASPARLVASITGFVLAVGLLALRQRLPMLPFHPLGLATAGSWYMVSALWSSIFVGWLAKVVLLRYWGRAGFVSALPLFLGLILGDCVWGSFWLTYGLIAGVRTYSVWF